LAGSIGIVGEGEDLGVVHKPVDHGRSDNVIVEEIILPDTKALFAALEQGG
jgi:hypothetical protein